MMDTQKMIDIQTTIKDLKKKIVDAHIKLKTLQEEPRKELRVSSLYVAKYSDKMEGFLFAFGLVGPYDDKIFPKGCVGRKAFGSKEVREIIQGLQEMVKEEE